jgi:hypothetical protein
MLCDNCKIAGRNNANGMPNRARKWHKRCSRKVAPSQRCTCQHKVGKWINQRGDK